MPHSDRRRTERLIPWTKTHVTVTAGGDLLPARVTNISRRGVAAAYASIRLPDCGPRVHVDILVDVKAGLLVTGLLCRMVYDHLTLSEGSSYTGMATRQCGLEFISPNNRQSAQLERLLSGLSRSSAD